MPEQVRLDADRQLICVEFDSASTVEDWRSALVHVERLAKDTGIRRVLIDVRHQAIKATTVTLFEFASHLPRSMAFAVLCETQLETHHFIENVATNRGITVRDFDSYQNAIAWLENWPKARSDNANGSPRHGSASHS